jgi:hypothetical protein
MRSSRLRLFLVLVICSFADLSSGLCLSFGQESPRQDSRKLSCNAGNLNFACPEGFKLIPAGSQQDLALLFKKKYGLGLFVVAPGAEFDERRLMTDVTKTALANFFPKESQAFSWRPMNYSGSVSKYEVGGGMAKGFNGKLSVVIKYRRIRVNEKDIFVGYVAEFGKGGEAKQFFEGAGYGDSLAGCNEAVEVIYSITNEKVDEDHFPCELVVPSPAG